MPGSAAVHGGKFLTSCRRDAQCRILFVENGNLGLYREAVASQSSGLGCAFCNPTLGSRSIGVYPEGVVFI
jgi:hypothetical protein